MTRYIIVVICVFPVLAGLIGVFLPAFGWFPIYGKSRFTHDILALTFHQEDFQKQVKKHQPG